MLRVPLSLGFAFAFAFAIVTVPLVACRGGARPSTPRAELARLSARTVTLLHVTDYHSHALPFASEGRRAQGGIARLVGYAKREKARGATLVLSGGDTMNRSTPAWSDKYGCVEWPWLDGVLDAMAFGNHDADYGFRAFAACRASVQYPVLAANVVGADGTPVFTYEGKPYVVREAGGLKVGIFAVAGADFPALMKPDALPAGARIEPREATIRRVSRIVSELRAKEHADVVVLIGHEEPEGDAELAQRVPGIDVIFGSHAHAKRPFQTIAGTQTATLSAFQYGAYVARVTVTIAGGPARATISGELVPMDETVEPDATVAAEVARLEAQLEADPTYAPRFVVVGRLAADLAVDAVDQGASPLASFVVGAVRDAAHADVAFVGASSFRAPLAAGPVRREDLLAALPYPNRVETFRMTGAQLVALLEASAARRGTGSYLAAAGVATSAGAVDVGRTYLVATTDFVAHNGASPYRALFANATRGSATPALTKTVTEIVEERLAAEPARDGAEGRIHSTP